MPMALPRTILNIMFWILQAKPEKTLHPYRQTAPFIENPASVMLKIMEKCVRIFLLFLYSIARPGAPTS